LGRHRQYEVRQSRTFGSVLGSDQHGAGTICLGDFKERCHSRKKPRTGRTNEQITGPQWRAVHVAHHVRFKSEVVQAHREAFDLQALPSYAVQCNPARTGDRSDTCVHMRCINAC
jgi:hypothetical protein